MKVRRFNEQFDEGGELQTIKLSKGEIELDGIQYEGGEENVTRIAQALGMPETCPSGDYEGREFYRFQEGGHKGRFLFWSDKGTMVCHAGDWILKDSRKDEPRFFYLPGHVIEEVFGVKGPEPSFK